MAWGSVPQNISYPIGLKLFFLAASVGAQPTFRELCDQPFAGTIIVRWLLSVRARIASREPILFGLPGVTEVGHHAGIPRGMGRRLPYNPDLRLQTDPRWPTTIFLLS